MNKDSETSQNYDIYALRRNKLRKKLQEKNLDAMLVFEDANRFYLSGFELHDGQANESSGCLVVSASGDDWLATDRRFEEAAARIWPKERIFIYSSPLAKDIAKLLRLCGSLVGVEAAAISARFFMDLKKWRSPALMFADGLVEDLRMIKEPCEIAAMKKSFALNHKMLSWLQEELDAGNFTNLTESEIAWAIEQYFRQNGAQELAFSTIAAVGKNAALPHAVPGLDKLDNGKCLLVDIGCRVDNYCSDQTRTFWLGQNPDSEFRKTLELVRKAQEAAISAMKPGVACSEIYNAARQIFVDAGVEKAFNHGLGHGIGLQTHEAPSLSPRDGRLLQKGMTVTVEPGLYYPQWGGVRWEHTVLVEEDGVSVL